SDRYASAAALADDLGRWQRGDAPLAYPDSPPHRLLRFARRHRAATVLIAIAILGAGAGVAAAVVAYRNNPERTRESTPQILGAGKPAPPLADRGPPKHEVAAIGAETAFRSTDLERPYHVATHGVALVELWPSPPSKYRFEVDVRHEDNPVDGSIGIYFD